MPPYRVVEAARLERVAEEADAVGEFPEGHDHVGGGLLDCVIHGALGDGHLPVHRLGPRLAEGEHLGRPQGVAGGRDHGAVEEPLRLEQAAEVDDRTARHVRQDRVTYLLVDSAGTGAGGKFDLEKEHCVRGQRNGHVVAPVSPGGACQLE